MLAADGDVQLAGRAGERELTAAATATGGRLEPPTDGERVGEPDAVVTEQERHTVVEALHAVVLAQYAGRDGVLREPRAEHRARRIVVEGNVARPLQRVGDHVAHVSRPAERRNALQVELTWRKRNAPHEHVVHVHIDRRRRDHAALVAEPRHPHEVRIEREITL